MRCANVPPPQGAATITKNEGGEVQNLPIVERFAVPVVFSTRIVRVERTGDNVLMVYGFDTLDEAGRPIVEVVAKILRPVCSFVPSDQLLSMAQPTGLAPSVSH